MTWTFESRSAAATEDFASKLGAMLRGGELILLRGPLGAGKTCFVRGLARGLGIPARQVRSPSFTIHHRYEGGRLVLDHYDAYFVRDADEFARDGLEEQLSARHVAIVEWADRYPAVLASAALAIDIAVTGEESRTLTLSGSAADLGFALLFPG